MLLKDDLAELLLNLSLGLPLEFLEACLQLQLQFVNGFLAEEIAALARAIECFGDDGRLSQLWVARVHHG